jgi:uroporphyrinogen-III synthase
MPTLVITRPKAAYPHTAAWCRAYGYTPVACPLLTITSLPYGPPPVWARYRSVLLTSIHAVPACRALAMPQAMLCWVVGMRTAAALQEAGYRHILPFEDSARLYAALHAAPPISCLYMRGRVVHQDLAGDLTAIGYTIHERVVYDALPCTRLPEAVRTLLVQHAAATLDAPTTLGVLYCSARTAETWVACVQHAAQESMMVHVDAYAFSQAVAAPLRTLPFRALHVAASPSLAGIAALFAHAPPQLERMREDTTIHALSTCAKGGKKT